MKRRLERLPTPQLLGTLSAVSAVSLLADALSPLLLKRAPELLVLASPRSMYVVAVTNRVPLVFLLPVVTVRLCLTDPVHFELGRRVPVGPRSHGVLGHLAARARRAIDAVPAVGWLVAVAAWPVSHTLMGAGAGGAKRRSIAFADIAGTALRVGFMCFVLGHIGAAVNAAHTASHVGPLAALNFIGLTTITLVLRRRTRKQSDTWDDVAQQVEALRLEDRVLEAYGLAWTGAPTPGKVPQPQVPQPELRPSVPPRSERQPSSAGEAASSAVRRRRSPANGSGLPEPTGSAA